MPNKSRSKRKSIQRDDDASEPYSDELDVSSPEVLELGDEGEVVKNSDWTGKKFKKQKTEKDNEKQSNQEDAESLSGNDDLSDDDSEEEEWESEEEVEEDEDEDEAVKRKLSTVSFGSLAKAQDSLPTQSKKRKRIEHDDETEEKLAALRKRLKEIEQVRKSKVDTLDEDGSDSELQSEPSENEGGRKGRSSKHAPTSLSSKRAVSRKREAIYISKTATRDPRFDGVSGQLDREKHRKNYAFLDDYVDSEIKELKNVLKTQKTPAKGSKKKKPKGATKLSPDEIEALKRELTQKESKRATQEARDRRTAVVREHKKKEKDLVRTGKKPFFLKNSDVQKQVLVNKFSGMSEGKREKVMEKKRRKVTAKERRNMPDVRRGVE